MDQQAVQTLAQIQQATARLLATIADLADGQAREPSPLPGWSRGHVLTHIARNADAIANLLRSARTGTQIPMYASREARDADIEAGAGRPAGELVADVRASAAALEAQAANLPDEAWSALVLTPRGQVRARVGLFMRLSEVEIHHVDLSLGYHPRDWPDSFVGPQVSRLAATWADRDDVPAFLLRPDGGDAIAFPRESEERRAPVAVSGPGWALLAWLVGREHGAELTTDPPGSLPAMPPW